MLAALVSFFLWQAPEPQGEFELSVYGGWAETRDNDLTLKRSGERVTFHDVSYDHESLRDPIYYGLRAAWFPGGGRWGAALDFFYAKAFLETDDVARVSGAHEGRERIGDTIESFGMSHGLNFLTLNAVHRWEGFVQPYAGAGLGLVIPHVEARLSGDSVGEYQLRGPGFQTFAGIRALLAGQWALFVEGKISGARLDLDVPDGSIRGTFVTLHLVVGISFRF